MRSKIEHFAYLHSDLLSLSVIIFENKSIRIRAIRQRVNGSGHETLCLKTLTEIVDNAR